MNIYNQYQTYIYESPKSFSLIQQPMKKRILKHLWLAPPTKAIAGSLASELTKTRPLV